MNPILLDTHVAVWVAADKLPAVPTRRIDAAAERDELLLSPITAWEIGLLVSKGRLSLAPALDEYIRSMYGRPGVVIATLTPAIAAAATALPGPFHADPADRILIATAAAYGARIATRDKAIRDYARATKYVHCLEC